MIVLVNPASRGGKAETSWQKISSSLKNRGIEARTLIPQSAAEIPGLVASEYASGEREFVAAGGDGSVNALVNALMTALPEAARGSVAMGAIGLGSSNDFHKPLSGLNRVEGFPVRINFALARRRDVGMLEIEDRGTTVRRFFLVNASVGLTASANWFFNTPDSLLSLAKRTSTSVAISYAALHTIFKFKDLSIDLRTGSTPRKHVRLTNLNVLKSPHVSGALTYPFPPVYDDGYFNCVVASSMGGQERIRTLLALLRGGVPATPKLETFRCVDLAVESTSAFAVEFDGETVVTSAAKFSVLRQHLRVCTC